MSQPAPRYLLIVNGKSSGELALRNAVYQQRKAGMDLTVRVTWEEGDATVFTHQAGQEGFTHVIAGGGDGTVNEVVNGLMRLPREQRPVMGVVPLGSANDFARSIGLPLAPQQALEAVCEYDPQAIDVVLINATQSKAHFTAQNEGTQGSVNQRYVNQYYVNMLTGGFGAEVTSSTPKRLKRLLGGGAYSIMGAAKAWRHRSYQGTLNWGAGEVETSLLLLGLGNGRQSGGGQLLAPRARLNDGYLDVLMVRDFSSMAKLPRLMEELKSFPAEGEFVSYFATRKITVTSQPMEACWPLTLDGEARHFEAFSAEVEPLALSVAMRADSALLAP
ncbi:lipid kinase YegS [Halomonas sp. CH40]